MEELLASSLRVMGALVSVTLERTPRGEALREALAARGVEQLEVSEGEFASAADTEQPQGVLAIADVPTQSLDAFTLTSPFRLAVLDGIQDPGNVGTIVRTAAALGAAGVVALPGTADLWSAKAVRSAVGAQFRRPAVHAHPDELFDFLQTHDIALWATAADGADVATATPPARLALALGNEGAGVTPEVRARCAATVALPMSSGVESLNVAVAAGITLYALRP